MQQVDSNPALNGSVRPWLILVSLTTLSSKVEIYTHMVLANQPMVRWLSKDS